MAVRATVGGDGRAGDVACSVGRQEGDDLGDLLRLGGAVERRGRAELSDELRPGRCRGVDRTGGDGVDADTAAAELGGPVAGHRRKRGLRRAVGRAAGGGSI
jgi:hypothetical protein